MPIDTSVPLSTGLNFNVAPPVVDDPQQALAKSLTLQGAMQQRQLNQQSIQEGQLGLQQKRQAISDQQGIQQAFIDANGDAGQLVPLATKHGVSGAGLIGLQKNVTEIQKAAADKDKVTLENTATKNDRISGALDSLVADPANADPATFAGNLGTLKATLLADKTLSPAEAQNVSIDHLTQVGGGDPMAGAKLYNGLIKLHSGVVKDALTAAQTDEAASKANASNAEAATKNATRDSEVSSAKTTADQKGADFVAQQAGAAKNQQQWDAMRADAQTRLSPQAFAAIPAVYSAQAAGQLRQAGLSADQQVTAGQTALRDANTSANERARIAEEARYHNMTIDSVHLTPQALDQIAERFSTTGELPNFGSGAQAGRARSAVINRATELHPNANLAENAGAYHANKESFAKVTSMLDNVTSFEATANKNLTQFINLAKGMKDTGVPWMNAPVRLVDEKLAGSENMAKVEAARQVALREIAMVANNPNLQGALSDSARTEVMNLSPKDATFKQILGVAQVLHQDIGNRHEALQQQHDAIAKRLAGSSAPSPSISSSSTTPYAHTATGPGGHKIGTNDGKSWFDVQTNQKVQ